MYVCLHSRSHCDSSWDVLRRGSLIIGNIPHPILFATILHFINKPRQLLDEHHASVRPADVQAAGETLCINLDSFKCYGTSRGVLPVDVNMALALGLAVNIVVNIAVDIAVDVARDVAVGFVEDIDSGLDVDIAVGIGVDIVVTLAVDMVVGFLPHHGYCRG